MSEINNIINFSKVREERELSKSNFHKVIMNNACCTPDFKELKNSKDDIHLLFVYDDLKKGKAWNHYLTEAVYFGEACTNISHFMMKMIKGVDYPVVFKCPGYMFNGTRVTDPLQFGQVKGELYGIPLRALTDVDLLNQNTMSVNREKTWIRLLDQDNHSSHQAYIYIGDSQFFDNGKFSLLRTRNANSENRGHNRIFFY